MIDSPKLTAARFPEPRPSGVGTMIDGAEHQRAEARNLEGTCLLDRYQVLRKLGEGGMGTVYLAEHTTIRKKLAIKVLAEQYATNQDLRERFLQEARSASMIRQQNIVEITDFGTTDSGLPFFVMEFLEGEDLGGTIGEEGALEWTRVQHIMLQICAALGAAHERGIVHRDMKPENCFRIKRGADENFIKVLDFGIAKVMHPEGDSPDGDAGSSQSLTRTGMVLGTPEYMSPEQASGLDIDHRADVYAAGVIMYELLTGTAPFQGKTFMAILSKHMFELPQAPLERNPDADVNAAIEAVVLKALQKDPQYRFQSMGEFAQAIGEAGAGTRPVEVIQETITAPTVGLTTFSGTTAQGLFVQEREKRDYKLAILGGLVLALAGALLFVLFFRGWGDGQEELAQADLNASETQMIGVGHAPDAEENPLDDPTPKMDTPPEPKTPPTTDGKPPDGDDPTTPGAEDGDDGDDGDDGGALKGLTKKKKKKKKKNGPRDEKDPKTVNAGTEPVGTLHHPELSNPFDD